MTTVARFCSRRREIRDVSCVYLRGDLIRPGENGPGGGRRPCVPSTQEEVSGIPMYDLLNKVYGGRRQLTFPPGGNPRPSGASVQITF